SLGLAREGGADDPDHGLVTDEAVLDGRGLGRVAGGVELLHGDLSAALGVLLVDGHPHAVADVDAEVGVVAGEGAHEADGGGLRAAPLALGGGLVVVAPAGGQHQGRDGNDSDDPPAAPNQSRHVKRSFTSIETVNGKPDYLREHAQSRPTRASTSSTGASRPT